MEQATECLLENAGPVIRWRMLRDWGVGDPGEREGVLKEVLATGEVRRWLSNLGGTSVHGGRDTDAENPMAKLIEYGLRNGIAEFDAKMLPYAEKMKPELWDTVSDTAGPFLIAAGYSDHEKVRAWFLERLDVLHRVAEQGDFDFYVPPEEAGRVPKAWRGKPVFKPEYCIGPLRLPLPYDLYAIAHWPRSSKDDDRKIRTVIAFIADPRFQEAKSGYLWDTRKRRCYAAGGACLNEHIKVLYLELTARFKECRTQPWFRTALTELERHRTDRGTYCFPPDYLKEKSNAYYLYAGSHMGLGENRRRPTWLEIESTFRMLNIQRLMAA